MDFFPIYAGSLQPNTTVPFDAFVQVAIKFLPYIEKAEKVDAERLRKLVTNTMPRLFVPILDEPAYFEYLKACLEEPKPAKNPIEHLFYSLCTVTENLPRRVENEGTFQQTAAIIYLISDFLSARPSAIKSEFFGTMESSNVFEHSAKVAILSMALAPRLGLQDSQELRDMGVAALLHDLGKLSLNLPWGASLEDLPRGLAQAYSSHPALSVEIVSDKRYVNVRIRRLIADHEEMGQGEGFPGKKNIVELSLSSQILNLCNDFERYTTQQKTSLIGAFKTYTRDKRGLFDSLQLLRLGEMLSGK
ncbi:HD domain-containing phosphohydrolase [Bdellovibrionota bacterium FG-2]